MPERAVDYAADGCGLCHRWLWIVPQRAVDYAADGYGLCHKGLWIVAQMAMDNAAQGYGLWHIGVTGGGIGGGWWGIYPPGANMRERILPQGIYAF